MAGFVTSKVGKILAERVFDDVAKNRLDINGKNPYEETIEVRDRHGNIKKKKQKRSIPPYLSAQDAKVLKRVRARAYKLDMSLFNCCGIRFGWSSVVAIIPVIGDFIDVFFALLTVRMCQKIEGGLPQQLRARMIFNIMVDFAIGLVPILGDVADALFRANTRNAWLLETYLTKRAQAQKQGAIQDPDTGDIIPVQKLPPNTIMASEDSTISEATRQDTAKQWHQTSQPGHTAGSSTRPTNGTLTQGQRVGDQGSAVGGNGTGGGGGSGWRRFFGSSNGSAPARDEEMTVGVGSNGNRAGQNNGLHQAQQSGVMPR